jgi:hypothetical protein
MRRPSPIFFPVLVGAVLLALGVVTATSAQEICPPPHDDYRRPTPVWEGFGHQVNACAGDKIEVAASLKVHPSIDRGVLQIPETLPWHVDLAALPQVDKDYLREHCEPDLPCVTHFKITVLRIIRRAPIAGERREGQYDCHTEPSGTPICRVPGTEDVIATLDGWR